jgi:hypothetical protein
VKIVASIASQAIIRVVDADTPHYGWRLALTRLA